MIRLTNAAIGYRRGFERKIVLDSVNLEIARGSIYFIRGSNGSGKTTLAMTILGLLPLLGGSKSNGFGQPAYVPQRLQLDNRYPISLARLAAMGFKKTALLQKFSPRFRRQRNAAMIEALAAVGLQGNEQLLVREASGGQLQRSLIARALLSQPDFVLMDEPFTNLDLAGKNMLSRLIREQNQKQGLSFCIIDHDGHFSRQKENSNLDIRIIEIDNGQLLAGEPEK